MFRLICVLLALAVFASISSAQPRQLPLAPGVMPGSTIGPGTQFLPQPTPRFVPTGPGTGITVMARPGQTLNFGAGPRYLYNPGFGGLYGGFGYFPYSGYGYPQDYIIEREPVYVPVPVVPQQPNIVLTNEFPATLTIQLPPGKNMKVNGKSVEDAPEGYTLTSPALKSGEKYTFSVNVRWQRGGKTYEAKRSVAVAAGERSRLLLVSGEEVRE